MKPALHLLKHVIQISPVQLKNLSLPVQREVVEARLELADNMVDLFEQYSREDKARRMLEARKGSVEKVRNFK